MVPLPIHKNLPVEFLAGSFDNVTNSYKYYWFLAILEHVRLNQSPWMAIDDLLSIMLALAWYPANYFRLSFGKQDRLGQIVFAIGEHANIPMDTRKVDLIRLIKQLLTVETPITREIRSLGNYVPYRFLRPFFASELKGEKDTVINNRIESLSELSFLNSEKPVIYCFSGKFGAGIELYPDWFDYINRHIAILQGFCLWNLVNYIQKNNPNVPNISGKLFEPSNRDLKIARAFWNLIFDEFGTLNCIYSGQVLQKDEFTLDHFLPWSFVAHDLLWNIIPIPGKINSAKSDNLPDLGLYFEPFAAQQYQALHFLADSKNARLLEDYSILLKTPSASEIMYTSFDQFKENLFTTIAPQVQVAANMGFTNHWRFSV